MIEEKEVYDALKIAFVLVIVLSIAFNAYMRENVGGDEGFSEVYFNDHRNLPQKLQVNESREVSFTIVNHELSTTEYVYEIDSKTGGYRENITILPGQQAVIKFSIKPLGKVWSLNLTTDKLLNNSINIFGETRFMGNDIPDIILGNASGGRVIPISHNISGFGYVYHTNLSVEKLQETPFTKTYSESHDTENTLINRRGYFALTSDGENIFLALNETDNTVTALMEPFKVRVYKSSAEAGDELDIQFWYEIAQTS